MKEHIFLRNRNHDFCCFRWSFGGFFHWTGTPKIPGRYGRQGGPLGSYGLHPWPKDAWLSWFLNVGRRNILVLTWLERVALPETSSAFPTTNSFTSPGVAICCNLSWAAASALLFIEMSLPANIWVLAVLVLAILDCFALQTKEAARSVLNDFQRCQSSCS